MDYRFDPRFLVGIGVGYTHGWEWVNGFAGQGWTDSVSVAAYGSFNQGGFYVDALAGYAYYSNQLQRQILIPGLQQRTATGSTGANQFLGQVETGYKLGVYAPASATVTPFGRLQTSSVTQNGFTEAGAQSLNLNVAQQTTNSLRTIMGADLAGAIGIGDDEEARSGNFGWAGCTSSPIPAGRSPPPLPAHPRPPSPSSPPRRGATARSRLLGQADIADGDADLPALRRRGRGGTDNHALNLGVRFSW